LTNCKDVPLDETTKDRGAIVNSATDTVSIVSVPFHGDELQALHAPDGKVWVVLRRACEALGIPYEGQRQRLQDSGRSPWATTSMMLVVAQDQKQREVVVIDLDTLPMWLATIDSSRVAEHVREKLVVYQKECARVLRDRFLGPNQGDAILDAIEHTRQIRLAQIETEKRLSEVRRLAASALQRADAAFGAATNRHGFFTVLGWLRLNGRTVTVAEAGQHGRRLSAICRQASIAVHEVSDPRFGRVNCYPEEVLENYFSVVND
jgi:hypothetical protein